MLVISLNSSQSQIPNLPLMNPATPAPCVEAGRGTTLELFHALPKRGRLAWGLHPASFLRYFFPWPRVLFCPMQMALKHNI